MTPSRVLLCDDHLLFSDALAAVLSDAGFEVVGITTTPEQAVDTAGRTRPDVVVMDLTFDGRPKGLAATRAVIAASPGSRVLLLTGSDDPRLATQAIAAGASGACRKGVGAREVARLVGKIADDEAGYDLTLLREAVRPPRVTTSPERRLFDYLTPREREVLQLLAQGANTTKIARRLGVGTATARTHVQAVLMKLGTHSRVEAVALAVRHRLVSSAPPETS